MKNLTDIWKGQLTLPLPNSDAKFHAGKAKFHDDAAEFFCKAGLQDREQFQRYMSEFHQNKSKE